MGLHGGIPRRKLGRGISWTADGGTHGCHPAATHRIRHRELAVKPRDPRRTRRAGSPSELLWSGLVFGAPLVAGLAANAALGWWPGLAVFLFVALIVGSAAYQHGR